MYKTHIKQWGLDKKNKEPEMRAIVYKYQQRADQGKNLQFVFEDSLGILQKLFSIGS